MMVQDANFESGELECFQNVQRFYNDAMILYTNGRFASAVVMAVFGIEEMAKALTCQILTSHKLDSNERKLIQQGFGDHKAKIDFATFRVDVEYIAKASIEIVEDISQLGDEEKQAEILNQLLNTQPVEIEQFHSMRLRASFVDMNLNTSEILSSPQRITQADAQRAIEKLTEIISEYSGNY
jgi:AbiV family abortive infection protein